MTLTPNAQHPTLNAQPSLELHIEELVLHGYAPSHRYAIGDAVERELERLLAGQGIPISFRSESATDEIRGALFNAAQDAKPPAIGREVAHAIYGSLTPATASRRETRFSEGGSE
jgi:hypothetical protein